MNGAIVGKTDKSSKMYEKHKCKADSEITIGKIAGRINFANYQYHLN